MMRSFTRCARGCAGSGIANIGASNDLDRIDNIYDRSSSAEVFISSKLIGNSIKMQYRQECLVICRFDNETCRVLLIGY